MPKAAKKNATQTKAKSQAKATTVSASVKPASLGTKRQCHKCGTKFYDFEKPEVFCPKCNAKIDLEALNPFKESKRSRVVVEKDTEEDVVVDVEESTGAASGIESLEELDDAAEEEIVEKITVEDEENDF